MSCSDFEDDGPWPRLGKLRDNLKCFKGADRVCMLQVDGKLYAIKAFGHGERYGADEGVFVFSADQQSK